MIAINTELPTSLLRGISCDDAWRIYHLLRGGIDTRNPFTLVKYSGVPWSTLSRLDLSSLFLWCDNRWVYAVRTSSPLPADLNTGKPLVLFCDWCGTACTSLPCPYCDAIDRGPAWTHRRRQEGLLPYKPGRKGTTDPTVIPNGQYHGE